MTTQRGDGAAPRTLPAPGPASRQDGTYPRPQLVRAAWTDLDGPWAFRHDDADAGLAAGWSTGFRPEHDAVDRTITVPFPPESVASGIDEPGFHPVVWYSRAITAEDLEHAGRSADAPRVLLHFGAVDHRARVWLDGVFLGEHEGGHTPFSFDVTHVLDAEVPGAEGETPGAHAGATPAPAHTLVVRAEDDPHDVTQPRGKQDWHEHPHAIWYRRTTGIWQTVWLEAVPTVSVAGLRWDTTFPGTTVRASVRLAGRPDTGTTVTVALRYVDLDGDEDLGTATVTLAAGAAGAGAATSGPTSVDVVVPVARQTNGQAYDELTWSPETPRLVDATVVVAEADGTALDQVASYLGIRSAAVDRGAFLLNDRPYDVRSVLEQGYWPESNLTAPSPAALRREVELIKELGFTAARIHQKIEDPRFLFWADRLGLLVWGEAPGAYAFGPVAVQRLMREWMDAVERDVSHPCIVTWVPANESWGVQHIAHDPAQQAYARALADVTRALDPSRPVISNDGWEHAASDIISVHDYEAAGPVLAVTYADAAARTRLLAGMGPAGRRILVGDMEDRGQPVMLTEFGGVNFQPGQDREDAWGYSVAADGDDYVDRVTALYDAIRASAFLAGSCYTQLTDTLQETNGLLTADREPKVPIERIRRAIVGHD